MKVADIAGTIPTSLRFDIFPAIHLRNGQTIDFTGHSPDEAPIMDSWQPLESAKFWIDEGASWIHIVDIDALFKRDTTLNWQTITQLCELPVKVQLVGGNFDLADIDRAMKAGVHRVLLDASQKDINLLASTALASYGPESLGVIFTTSGIEQTGVIKQPSDWPTDWEAAGGEQIVTRALQLYHLGITTGVHTTIAKDGTMSGCDVRITQELASLSGMNFLVGGEVYDMDDVVHCYNRKGVTGILIGRALYNGTINLQRALNNTRRKIAFETGLPDWKQEQVTLKARLRYKIANDYLQEHLPDKRLRALDAGGGNGLDALYLAGIGHEVDLLDESMAMINDFEKSNEHQPAADHVTTHNCNIREIPKRFDDNEFDIVLCHNVIQYVVDWQSILHNAVKPLKRGGIFSLITRNIHALPYQTDYESVEPDQVDDFLDLSISHSPVFDSKISLFSPNDLIGWLEQHQFVDINHYGILSLHHYAALSDQAENEMLISKLESIEYKLGKRSPHRDVARYVQLVAIKS
jgi:S-adenosylmethionine-dependent methyltransferase